MGSALGVCSNPPEFCDLPKSLSAHGCKTPLMGHSHLRLFAHYHSPIKFGKRAKAYNASLAPVCSAHLG